MVRALLFDVFGTVVDWRRSVARELASALRRERDDLDWNALAVEWRSLYRPAMEEVISGRRPFVPLDVLHRENLDTVFARNGLTPLPKPRMTKLNTAWHRLDPWPDSAPGLARLHSRLPVATCSNGNVALMVNLARHGGLRWDAILGAEITGAYKPDPQAYLGSARALGLKPEDCMMVAAHNDDLAAARDIGLRTAFIPRPDEHEDGGHAEPTDDWDIVAEGLEALAARFGA